MNTRSQRQIVPVLALLALLLAAGLRFHQLGAQSLWNDEGNSVVQAGRSLVEIAEHAARDIHPPGYYWLLSVWSALTGTSEFALRAFSALASVLSVAFAFSLGRRLYGAWPGLIAALLVALNTFSITYAQETRMYALLALFGAAGLWALVGLVQRPGWKWALALGLINAAGMYTHYAYPFLIVVQCVLVAVRLLQQRRCRPAWIGLLGAFVLSGLITGALFLPLASTAWAQVTGWPSTGAPVSLGEALREIGLWLTFGVTAPEVALALPVIVLIFGLLDTDPRPDSRWRALVPVLWAALPVAAFLVLGLYRPENLKFLIASQIGLALWLARGFAVIWTLRPYRHRGSTGRSLRFTARAAALTAGAWIFGVMLTHLPALYTDPALQRADYRAIAAEIGAGERPGDAIILNAPNQNEVFSYYWRGIAPVYLLPAGLGGDDAETAAEVESILTEYERVWAVFWGEGERDPNHVVETMLDTGAFEGGDRWFGDVRLVQYVMPAPLHEGCVTDATFGESITLLGCRLNTRAAAPGDALQVELTWGTTEAVPARYKVFVQLIDSAGQLVAQHDSEPASGRAPTTSWLPGEPVIDHHALFLPADLAPGQYTLIAGLYLLDAPQTRLPLTSGGDALTLGSITVR